MPQVEIEVKERPILFSGAMVKAILDGRKTQTRRVAKGLASCTDYRVRQSDGEIEELFEHGEWSILTRRTVCPYGKPGDRLWVRESFAVFSVDGSEAFIGYKARLPKGKTISETDGGLNIYALESHGHRQWAIKHINGERWMPSIHMPRWASRITLEIKSVRVERIQDISGHDCLAEGIPVQGGNSSDGEWRLRKKYRELWDSINAKRGYGWEKNPWCWAIEFRRA